MSCGRGTSLSRPWALAALLSSGPALAGPLIDFSLEGAAATPVGAQASNFGFGGGGAVRAQLHLVGPLRLQVGGGYLALGSKLADAPQMGAALWAGGGARVVALEGAAGSVWGGLFVDAQANVVGTGPVARFGWEAGLGALFRPTARFGVGPFVRFLHIVDPTEGAFVLLFGVTASLGPFPNTPPPKPTDITRDADGDGIVDSADRCPSEPETFNGVDDGDGCPDQAPVETTTRIAIKAPGTSDRDGDGFIDERDACPDEAEVFNGVSDDDGCPDPGDALVVLTAERLELKQPLRLDKVKGAYRVANASMPMLGAAAIVLSLHPEVRLVRVEVHGEKRDALKRAEAVREAMVSLGLDGARLEAASAAPESGGEKNRVELVLVK